MKRHALPVFTLLLALMLTVSSAAVTSPAATRVAACAARVTAQAPALQLSTVGGDWAALGLLRSGAQVPASYYADYYAAVERAVTACKGQLSTRKYTEYSRVSLALTALGRDPTQVAGYNLLLPLGDYERSVHQGVNGAIFALLALDSADYELPKNPAATTQATRELYIQNILSHQCPGGGFAASGSKADPDVTAMALTALARYRGQPAVAEAVNRGIACLSAMQTSDGGFFSQGISNCESAAQVLIALCTLGISQSDSRFIKDGHSVFDALLTFSADNGGFSHVRGGEADGMPTEQALCALTALTRAENGQSALYDLRDVSRATLFSDISGHPCQAAIEALSAKGIVGGTGGGRFAPDATMTRAQFAVILTRSLALGEAAAPVFSDVAVDAWYADAVGAAHAAGLIQGVGNGKFLPQGSITVRAAELMLKRAATLCDLADFDEGPMTDPSPITRGQLSQKLYALLQESGRI